MKTLSKSCDLASLGKLVTIRMSSKSLLMNDDLVVLCHFDSISFMSGQTESDCQTMCNNI